MREFIKFLRNNMLRLIIYSSIAPIINLFASYYFYFPTTEKMCNSENNFLILEIAFILFSISLLCAIVGLGSFIIQIIRKKFNLITLIGLIMVINFTILVGSARTIGALENSEQRITETYKPLIGALEVYKQQNGEYPEHLEKLVPRYLPEIPQSNICTYLGIEYKKIEISQWGPNNQTGGYQLRIETDIMQSFSPFLYWPSKNYPFCDKDSECKRINGWVYIPY